MMGELTGGLIQMNAKMVVTGGAKTSMVIGLLGAIVFVFWMVWAIRAKKKAWAILFASLALAQTALFAHGVTTPRVKEIRACVDGPISLERICSVYDIVSIDGKEIVLRER